MHDLLNKQTQSFQNSLNLYLEHKITSIFSIHRPRSSLEKTKSLKYFFIIWLFIFGKIKHKVNKIKLKSKLHSNAYSVFKYRITLETISRGQYYSPVC